MDYKAIRRAAEQDDRAFFDSLESAEDLTQALSEAVWAKRPELVESLVERGARAPKEWDIEAGTLLHEALRLDLGALIPVLIRAGCDPNRSRYEDAQGSESEFPLTLALRANDLEAARALLEGGADPNIEDVVDEELPNGFGLPDGMKLVDFEGTRIFPTFNCRSVEAVHLLVEFGATFETPEKTEHADPRPPWGDAKTPLHAAAMRAEWDVVARLIELELNVTRESLGLAWVCAAEADDARGLEVLDAVQASPEQIDAALRRWLAKALRFGTAQRRAEALERMKRLAARGARFQPPLPELDLTTQRALFPMGLAPEPEAHDFASAIELHDFDAYLRFVDDVELNPPMKGPWYLKGSAVTTPLQMAVRAGCDEIAADLVRRGAVLQSKRDGSACLAEKKGLSKTLTAMREAGIIKD